MEVSRTFNGGTSSKKWLRDAFKLGKALYDMLFRLLDLFNGDEKITKEVQVVGFHCAGLSLEFIRLAYPGVGYVSLLKKEMLVSLPNHVIGGLKDLIRGLTMMARFKEAIRASAAAVAGRNNGQCAEELYQELVDGKAQDGALSGWTVVTP